MHTPEEIAEFDKIHGIGAYERCLSAANRAMRTSRISSLQDIGQIKLEREGIPSALAAAFVDLVHPRRPRRKLRPQGCRASERIVRRALRAD